MKHGTRFGIVRGGPFSFCLVEIRLGYNAPMRRSDWRPLPRDPRSPLAWWWRDARGGLGFACLLLPCLGGPFVFLVLTRFTGTFGHVAFAVGASVVATILALRRRHLPSGLVALAPHPAPVEAFPVEVLLSQGDVATGRDKGIASFVEGWLHVEGLRASFSFRPVDTARIGFSKGGFDRFDLPGGQSIEIRPLAASASDRATFQETVRVWYRFPAFPTGEPLLPPEAVHPSAASGPLTTLAVHLLFLIPTVAFFLFFAHWQATAQLLPILIVPTMIAFRGAFVAARDLRRLAAFRRRSLGVGEAMGAVPK